MVIHRLFRRKQELSFSGIEEVKTTKKFQLMLYRNGKKIVTVDLLSDNYERFKSGLERHGNQYVVFTKIINEQVQIHGRTRKAVEEAIRICKERDVLKDYLAEKEREVVDIMIALYDTEQVMHDYVASEKRVTREEDEIRFYLRLRSRGFSHEDAQEISEISDKLLPKANKLWEKGKTEG